MLAKGNNSARSGSRAMVETIAVTDGELTALSALSGQQLLAADSDEMVLSEAPPVIEETVCVTIPNEESMEIEEEEFITGELGDSVSSEAKIEVSAASTVVVSSNNIIRGTPVLFSAAGQHPSTSYVVIQSSPGNRVVTTNNPAGKKGLQIPQIVGRINAGGVSPQFQTVVRPVSVASPQLISRSAVSVAGIRPLNPQAIGQRGQVVTKVLLPRTGAQPQVVALPVQDGKLGDQQRLILGGPQVRLLTGGMRVATIPGVSSEARIIKTDGGKPTMFQTSAGMTVNNPQGQPIKLVQARPMGVLTPNKVQQIVPPSPGGKGLIVNKVLPGTGTRVTIMPQGTKSPAKILPAPPPNPTVSPPKVFIRQATIRPAASASNLGLRIPTSSQPIVANSSGFQPVQIGGKQMQYVRLVSIPSASDSTATVTNTTMAKGSTVFTLASAPNTQPGSSIKMIPVGSGASKPVLAKSVQGQRLIIPASLSMTQIKTSVPSSVMSAVCSTTNSTPSSSVVVLPSTSLHSPNGSGDQSEIDIKPILQGLHDEESTIEETDAETLLKEPTIIPAVKPSKAQLPEPNGIKPRKPCNCTKSQCLKLYCDCFANGEFCFQCNCNCCFNNLEHEEDRQRAIRSCLERNPNAFRPKIGKGIVGDGRRHNKGCNCKRSGCLKNYCECYEAKIACSNNCKCIGCRNIEDDVDRRSLRELIEVSELDSPILLSGGLKKKAHQPTDISSIKLEDSLRKGSRRSDSIMSDNVVNATCECLVAQAEKADKTDLDDVEAEKLIIEEFGRCLVEIISCVTNRTDLDRQMEDSSSSVSETCESL